MQGDKLASGGTFATFPAGHAKKDDPVVFNWKPHTRAPQDEGPDPIAVFGDEKEHEELVSKLKPFNDRVLLRRVVEEDSKQVQLADSYKPKPNRGKVLALGELVPNNSVQVGDLVIFGEYNAENIEIDGEELVLTSAFDIRLKVG